MRDPGRGVGNNGTREPPRGRAARLDRLDRHPGDRHRAAQPGPVPGRRARRRRRQRRRCSPRRRSSWGSTRSAWPRRRAAQDLQLAFYAEAPGAGYATGDFRIPKILAGPDGDGRAGRWPVRRRAQRRRRLARARADAGRAARRAHPRAGQQGVADRRRPAGQGRGDPAGADRAGRLRALGAGPVPAGRRARPRSAGWCSPPAAARSAAGAAADLADVTVEQALAHPTWNMGPVVTINSATLVNKGARGDRGARAVRRRRTTDIEVVVHPQSVIHSMVEFVDGSTIAQASPPDMRLPIALALGWPDRVPDAAPAGGLDEGAHLGASSRSTRTAFPAVALAKAGRAGRPLPPGDLQRRQRGVRGRVHGGPAAVPRHRGHRRAGARRRHPTSPNQVPSRTCSPPRLGAGAWAARSIAAASGDERSSDGVPSGSCSSRWRSWSRCACTRPGTWCTAKAFGMKVTQYFVGFGPTLWSFRRGETEYGVKAHPARRLRQDRRHDAAGRRRRRPSDEPRAMWRFPVWKRTIVMSAGSVTHFILGVVILWIAASSSACPTRPTGQRRRARQQPAVVARRRLRRAGPRPQPGLRGRRPGQPGEGRRPAGRRQDHRGRRRRGHDLGRPDRARSARSRRARPTLTVRARRRRPQPTHVDLAAVQRPHAGQPGRARAEHRSAIGRRPRGRRPAAMVTYGPVDGVRRDRGLHRATCSSAPSQAMKKVPEKVPKLWTAITGERARPGDADQRRRRQPARRRGRRAGRVASCSC